MLKKILIGAGIVVLAFVLVGFVLPGEYRVERSLVISAEPAEIYPHVATLETWPDWTPWNREADPDCKWTYSGPDTGAGANVVWEGPKHGQGEMTITAADPAKGVDYDLAFDNGQMVSKGAILFAAEGDGTRVTWSNWGDLGMNPISRYFGLVLDGMMGPDFEKCLSGLKARVEGEE